MRMAENSIIIHDIELVWRRSGGGKWVAVLGPEHTVHFHQPPGCHWQARRPFALEPIATARTLDECVMIVKRQREARLAEIRARHLKLQLV